MYIRAKDTDKALFIFEKDYRYPQFSAPILQELALPVYSGFFCVLRTSALSGKDTQMKITWQFADGTKSEIEASDDIGTVILDSRREEDNLDRKERYHCYSFDALEYGDKDVHAPTTDKTPESDFLLSEDSTHIREALSALTDVQRRRLLMLVNGMSLRDIAKAEGANHKSVEESINSAKKNFRKIYSR